MPDSAIVVGLLVALLVIVTEPVRVPDAVGRKLTLTVQEAPVARVEYLSYWQYSFTLAQVAVPAFFTHLFEVRPDVPWLAIAVLAATAAAALPTLGRGLRHA